MFQPFKGSICTRDFSSCVRTHSIASGGLTFIVAFVVAFFIVGWFVVLYFKKRRRGHRRMRNDSNVERLLREAFNNDTNVVRSDADVVRMTNVVTSASTS